MKCGDNFVTISRKTTFIQSDIDHNKNETNT